MSDPGISYRSREEVAEVRQQRDCIENTKARILEAGFATAQELKEIEKSVRQEVDVAAKKADEAPQPELKELYEHIYTGAQPPYIRAVEMNKSIITPQ
jgi:pyruvate dehydrogenase E1 component alpha subunit